MLKKSTFLVAALTMIGFNAPTFAMPPKPEQCPNVGNIKLAGLSYVASSNNGYTVAQFNNYDTKDNWLFGFTSIKAASSQQALNIGRQWLSTLFGAPEPVAVTSQDVWACLYQTSNGNYGVALTPFNMSATINQSIMAAIH